MAILQKDMGNIPKKTWVFRASKYLVKIWFQKLKAVLGQYSKKTGFPIPNWFMAISGSVRWRHEECLTGLFICRRWRIVGRGNNSTLGLSYCGISRRKAKRIVHLIDVYFPVRGCGSFLVLERATLPKETESYCQGKWLAAAQPRLNRTSASPQHVLYENAHGDAINCHRPHSSCCLRQLEALRHRGDRDSLTHFGPPSSFVSFHFCSLFP